MVALHQYGLSGAMPKSSKVGPTTLGLDAAIEQHLAAAGVSNPAKTTCAFTEQEYDTWREVMLLSAQEFQNLVELAGLKHKSATKLLRYADDFRAAFREELTAERPESKQRAWDARSSPPLMPPASSPPAGGTAAAPVTEATVAGGVAGLWGSSGPTPDPAEQRRGEDDTALGRPGAGATDLTGPSAGGGGAPAAAAVGTAAASAAPVAAAPTAAASAEDGARAAELIGEATRCAQELADFGTACALFREALALDPGAAMGWFGLGFSLYNRDGGNTEEQATCYERAAELDPRHAMARSNLGNLRAVLRGDVDGAERLFREALALDPSCADAHNHLGWLLLRARGDAAGAEACFRTAVALDGGYGDARVNLGLVLAEGGAWGRAEEQFRTALASNPAHAEAAHHLDDLLRRVADCGSDAAGEEAGACAGAGGGGRGGAATPDGVAGREGIVGARAGGADAGGAGAGGVVGGLGRAASEQACRAALAKDPLDADALMGLGHALERQAAADKARAQRAGFYLAPGGHPGGGKDGDRDDPLAGAERCYRAVIAADPRHADAHNCLALLLESSAAPHQRVGEAEALYRRCLELDPRHASAAYNLGLLLETARRDLAGAEAMYRLTIALDPRNANAHSNLGILVKDARGDFDSAEALYRTALALDPRHSAAANNLGALLETARGDLAGAEAMYRAALDMDPSNGDAVLNLGILINGKAEALEAAFHRLAPGATAELQAPGATAAGATAAVLDARRSDSSGSGVASGASAEACGLAADAAALFCEAAALWDRSDGEGNRYSSEARLSASRLRALATPSRPGSSAAAAATATVAASLPSPAATSPGAAAAASAPASSSPSPSHSHSLPPSSSFAAATLAEVVSSASACVGALFRAVDRNGDGCLTRSELLGFLHRKGPKGCADSGDGGDGAAVAAEAAAVRATLCKCLGLPPAVKDATARACFELCFDIVDADGTATIEEGEMVGFVEDVAYLGFLYALACKQRGGSGGGSGDGSGDSGLPRLDPKIIEALEAIDSDRDGSLSPLEVLKALKAKPEIRAMLLEDRRSAAK